MRRPIQAIAVAATLCTLVAGCGREQPRPAPSPVAGSRALPRPTVPAPSDAAYVATASSIDLYEIRSSEMALDRSANAAVREFATMMIQAHKGTSSQLSLAGRRLNLLPSATLSPQHQSMIDALNSSGNFDALYRQQQATVHQQAVALHGDYASRGTSPTLRPVAAAILPIVERHQRMIRYM